MDELILAYPAVVKILLIMASFRLIMKPIFSMAHKLADETESKKDNHFISSVEQNKFFKIFVYVLDYALSVKIKKKL